MRRPHEVRSGDGRPARVRLIPLDATSLHDGFGRRLGVAAALVAVAGCLLAAALLPRVMIAVDPAGPDASRSEATNEVLAPTDGRVVDLPVQVGDRVEEGDVVARLDASGVGGQERAPASEVMTRWIRNRLGRPR